MDVFSLGNWFVLFLAAAGAGAVNAIAGGGTLISFPTLTALGVPAVTANITNTVALTPGYLGATLAQARDLRGQERRAWLLVPVGALGGLAGGFLLLLTTERLFRSLVPYLILLASGLLAAQSRVRAWVVARQRDGSSSRHPAWVAAPIFAAAVYGGYFGAGLSVIILAVLGVTLDDDLTRLNALKQAIAFAVNTAAAIFFVFSGRVLWPAALVMAVGAIIGGVIGGRVAGRISPTLLRRLVVVVGISVGLYYLLF